ncbi:hypothetical protein M885DRAFT_236683 [Pelagophyceae sp. CCMP2097]|nr:hypothetical protein M885DRAFT_236683 [Pelagophyceae sp. CCMP2097]
MSRHGGSRASRQSSRRWSSAESSALSASSSDDDDFLAPKSAAGAAPRAAPAAPAAAPAARRLTSAPVLGADEAPRRADEAESGELRRGGGENDDFPAVQSCSHAWDVVVDPTSARGKKRAAPKNDGPRRAIQWKQQEWRPAGLDLDKSNAVDWLSNRKKSDYRQRLDKEDYIEDADHEQICAICFDGGELVLCDACPRVFHRACAKLIHVPAGEWICPRCDPPLKLDRKQFKQKLLVLGWRAVTMTFRTSWVSPQGRTYTTLADIARDYPFIADASKKGPAAGDPLQWPRSSLPPRPPTLRA